MNQSLIWKIRWEGQEVALQGVIDPQTSVVHRFILEAGGEKTEILPGKPQDFVPLPEGKAPWPDLLEVPLPFQWGDVVVVDGVRLRWLAWGNAGKGVVGPRCASVPTENGAWVLLIRPVHRVTREELESLVIPMTAVAFKEDKRERIRPASIPSNALQELFERGAGEAARLIPLYLELPSPIRHQNKNEKKGWEI